jgi:phosphoribosylformylglycinamidine synthase subunit PurL
LAGGIGASLNMLNAKNAFGEDQGRFIVTAPAKSEIEGAVLIGTTGGDSIVGIPLATLRAAHEGFFPALMGKAG